MTALTADRNTQYKDGEFVVLAVAASKKIYAGSLVVLNASGYAEPGSTANNVTYVGRAEESVDNSSGSAGAKTVLVRRKKAFKWVNLSTDPIGQADLFKTCYIVDDQTVAKTSDTNARSAAGKVVGIDTDGVWVE
jgi:hypothetical protein